MPTTIQLRRGNTSQHSSFTGAAAEITFDTDKNTIVAHDGSTQGGHQLALATQNISNFTYTAANNTLTITTVGGNTLKASIDELESLQTKAEALAANNTLVSLIDDRLQVANAQTLFVNVSGDTMAGVLAMGGNKITGLGAPAADGDASTKKYVDDEVAGLVNSAPEALDTLNELAAALGDDANFATTITNTLSTKASNTYVNSTFQTKTEALTSNNSLLTLIEDRVQVANVASIARSSLSASGGINYNSSTGELSLAIGYSEISSNTTVTSNDNGKYFNVTTSPTPVFKMLLPDSSTITTGFAFNVVTANITSVILFEVSNASDDIINSQKISQQQIIFLSGNQIDDYDENLISDTDASLYGSSPRSLFEVVYIASNKFVVKPYA